MPLSETNRFDWRGLVEQSFLSLYQDRTTNIDMKCGYDLVFRFRQANLYVLIHDEIFETDSPDIQTMLIREKYYKVVNQIIKRHHKLQKKYQQQLGLNSTFTNIKKPVNYYIGLTSLAVSYQGKPYSIDCKLGSSFFQEDFVLDLDNKQRVIQIFNASSMLKMLQMLQTPIDFLSFINFYQSALINFTEFEHEIELANQYLQQGIFLENVQLVEKRLVEIELLDEVGSDDIIAEGKKAGSYHRLIDTMYQCSKIWVKLLIKLNKKMKGDIDRQLLVKLDEQSMYTRMKIIEEILNFAHQPETLQQQGYMRHQHAYHQFGQHFVLIFYGLQENAQLSQAYTQQHHEIILQDLSNHPQLSNVDEIFLLGFDMSHHTEEGDIDVQMDAYHLQLA